MSYKHFLSNISFPVINKKNEENNSLINENKMLKDELNKYKTENEQLKKEINQLNNDLIKANSIIENFNKNKDNHQNNNNTINNLNELIIIKDNIINDLKSQLQNNVHIKKPVDFNDIIVINFISSDNEILFPIKCLKTDSLAEVEEKFYQKYEEFRETNNNLLAKGKVLLRFKTICENNIQDGDRIQLVRIE